MRRTLVASALVFAAVGAQGVATASSSGHRAIHFGGLRRALQCFPGAIRPGERRPVFLSWNTARGGATPRRDFVYEIYMSRRAGDENFSKPNWTTKGHLHFTTRKLAPGRYFVVRARDRSGQQDHNRVQRRATSPCV